MRWTIAFIAGLILSYFHWVGIIIGGILVGLAANTNRQALVLGVALGIAVWLLFLFYMASLGLAGKVLALGPIIYMSFALTVLLSTLSASVKLLLSS